MDVAVIRMSKASFSSLKTLADHAWYADVR